VTTMTSADSAAIAVERLRRRARKSFMGLKMAAAIAASMERNFG